MSADIGKLVSGKSSKAMPNDPVLPGTLVTCGSSTELKQYADQSYDLVITDPPFGGLLHYAELADFFYVWLRLLLKDKYPEVYAGEYTPKTLEAVSNKARHPDDPDAFYKRLLTECWREANRLLKPGGILAFTFHHSEDEPWVDVLESLFDAGYYTEATYPIRSDETKGKGSLVPRQLSMTSFMCAVSALKRLARSVGHACVVRFLPTCVSCNGCWNITNQRACR